MLAIKMLGEVSFAVDGKPVKPLRSKTAAALLVYLACHSRPFSREYLAELFWADRTAAQSSSNLRTALKLLRPLFADYLIIDRQSLGFNHDSPYEIDALLFADQIEDLLAGLNPPLIEPEVKQLSDLLKLYGGPFLGGLYISDAPGFEAWQREEQTRHQRLAERGLRLLTRHYLAHGRYQIGIKESSRLLTFDPYDEVVHRDLMALLWRGGHRNEALQQYMKLQKLLAQELDLPPAPETTDLYLRIRSAPAAPKHNLPAETTIFVGRESHLAELETTVANPSCRLITVLGPGGVGKTRLLLEFGRRTLARYPGQFSDGVLFFALSQLSSGLFLATTLAATMGMTLSGSEDPLVEVCDYLRGKELLLLLDNFEQLLEDERSADAALTVVQQIIQTTPHVKIVISSRERLRLHEEWVFSLTGLLTPPENWEDQFLTGNEPLPAEHVAKFEDAFESVQLFGQIARRIDGRFAVTASNLAAIGEICRLLEGLPLGIELAAAWVRGMTPEEIIIKLNDGFDFLRASVRNKPERHQTLRNLFDHTWSLLTEHEELAMQRLSIFRGPFTATAAEAVAAADRSTLLALVDKSLLQTVPWHETQHYAIHELLRRYAAERLAKYPQIEKEIKSAHGGYFAQFIEDRAEEIKRGAPKAFLDEIATYAEELRAAWAWSRQSGEEEIVSRSLEGLLYFFWIKGWLFEGATAAVQTKEWLQETSSQNKRLLLQAQLWEAEFYGWLSRYDDAKMILEPLIPYAREANYLSELNFALSIMGRLQYWSGNYQEAKSLFTEELAIAKQLDNGIAISLALNCLANTVAEGEQDYPQVYALHRESLAISEACGDQLGSARALINLGVTAYEEGNLEEAQELCQRSLHLYQQLSYTHGISSALKYLCLIAIQQEAYAHARQLIEQSHALNRDAGDRRAIFESLCQLGNIARNEGDFRDATQRYRSALKLVTEMNSEKLGLTLFLDLAELLLMTDRQMSALRFVSFILRHPRSGQELMSAAEKLIELRQLDNTWATTMTLDYSDDHSSYDEMMAFALELLRP